MDASPEQSLSKSNNVSFGLHDQSYSGAEDDSVEVKKPEEAAPRSKSASDAAEGNNDVFEEPAATAGESATAKPEEEEKINAYLCIKVNKNREFMYCPLDRKMKNKLTSEFWFQINDNRFVRLLSISRNLLITLF
jgi:hypothetical protein